jgi:hypothetical protein
MRLLVVVAAALAVLVVAAPASADPPIGTNPNAVQIALTCGGQNVVISTIVHSASAAAQVTGSSGAVVLHGLAGFPSPDRTGTPLFQFVNRGFEQNPLQLVTCDFTNPQFPGVFFRGSFLFTPASR